MKPAAEIAIMAQVRPVNLTGFRNIYRKNDGGAGRHLFSFQNNGAVLAFGITTGGIYVELDAPISPLTFTDGFWHHVAATYDGITKRVYVDGVEIDSVAASGAIGTAGTSLLFRRPRPGGC